MKKFIFPILTILVIISIVILLPKKKRIIENTNGYINMINYQVTPTASHSPTMEDNPTKIETAGETGRIILPKDLQ